MHAFKQSGTAIWAAAALAMTLLAAPPAWAQPGIPRTAATPAVDSSWNTLTPAQKKALMPLAAQWHSLDGTSRDKWINVANRFPRLSAADQKRMQDRMTQWSLLPAQQRGEARLRFQNTRQLTPQERQQKWEAYQALSPEERQKLAQQARRKQKPVMLPDAEPGPREAAQQARLKGRQRADDGKTNLVPNPARNSRSPEAVAPAVVKAGPGATTSLVTQPATPPLHQHTGLPKIAATKNFVDPDTLLPRKGSQGAGMTPVTRVKPPAKTQQP
jgi:hypothetical protein